MKTKKLFYLIAFCVIVLLVTGIVWQHVSVNKSYHRFLKQYHLSENDIHYTHKGLSVGGKGLIFYQASFPELKISHRIDKLIVRQNGENISFQMQGLQIDVLQTLRHLYGQQMIAETENYKPFEEALSKPLLSLGLMGIYHLKGEAVFVFNPQTKPLVVNAQISLPHLAEIQLSFPIIHHDKRAQNLLQTVLGNVSEISVELMDNGLFQKYADYLQTINSEQAETYRTELTRHNNFIRRVQFEKSIDLKDFSHFKKPGE